VINKKIIFRHSLSLQSQEKEKMHESNVSQLQLTVDRMLNEARERQKTHSTEKKQLIDDKVRQCPFP
jgi:hypothetical protein